MLQDILSSGEQERDSRERKDGEKRGKQMERARETQRDRDTGRAFDRNSCVNVDVFRTPRFPPHTAPQLASPDSK